MHIIDRTVARVIVASLLIVVPSACDDGYTGPISFGGNRDAPADGGSIYHDQGEEDVVEQPDLPTPDAPPVDRLLREGAVGTITQVTDGDTLRVTVNGWYSVVRFQGINAPECHKDWADTPLGRGFVCVSDDEYWGLAAFEALLERAGGAEVTVRCDQADGEECPIDTFDRYLAFLEDEDGDIGEWMARNGHAMSFTKFSSSRRATYCIAEDLAISEDLGMWGFGDVDDVLDQMSSGTRTWYEDRDARCDAATR